MVDERELLEKFKLLKEEVQAQLPEVRNIESELGLTGDLGEDMFKMGTYLADEYAKEVKTVRRQLLLEFKEWWYSLRAQQIGLKRAS